MCVFVCVRARATLILQVFGEALVLVRAQVLVLDAAVGEHHLLVLRLRANNTLFIIIAIIIIIIIVNIIAIIVIIIFLRCSCPTPHNLCIDDVARRLGAGQVAHVHAAF